MASPEHTPTPMTSTAWSPLTRVDIGEVQLATRVLAGRGGVLLFIHGAPTSHPDKLAEAIRHHLDST